MDVFILVLAGIVSWALRASFIALAPGLALSPVVERVIANSRPAILAALLSSSLLAAAGGNPLAIPPAWLVATVATLLVAMWTQRLLATVIAGPAVLAAATFLGLPG